MLEWIKEGKSGDWEIRHFELTKHDEMMSVIQLGHRAAREGKYTGLFHAKRGVIMSDTPAEMRDLYGFRNDLHSHKSGLVHINGLGLGICVKMALDDGHNVEVVEIDQDVIELSGKQLLSLYPKKLTIIHADCLEYKPPKGSHYSIVWHDIWDNINLDNLEQYKFLNRRYARLTECQGAWARYEIDRMRKQEKRDEYFYSAFKSAFKNPLMEN